MEKHRAPNNRTLQLTINEEKTLKPLLLDPLSSPSFSFSDVKNRVINGDFFSTISKLPPHSVDLLIADPPYNLTKNYHGNTFNARSDETYAEFTRSWLKACIPLLKPEASVYVCCDWKSSYLIHDELKNQLVIQNRITWQREKGRGAKTNWKNSMEDIWFATVGKMFYFDSEAVKQKRRVIAPYKLNGEAKDWEETDKGKFRLTHASNFWDDISIPFWSMSENTDHPTQKPEKLLAKLILASSKPGFTVFDPFIGSGSTLVTAKKLGRNFFGIEQNEEYCLWALKRLQKAELDTVIQGYHAGVFWERNSQPSL